MKIPLSWLKEFVDLDLPIQQLDKILTLSGLEVDAVETLTPGFQKVVVGSIIQVEKHPDADKLSVALVSDGTDEYQVVCGAPNCRTGIKTAFAMVGARLQDDEGKQFKIKKSKLRGVESLGMLCTGKELGISEEHEGIMEFAEHLQVGSDLQELYGEVVLEVSLTPNLNHCASMIGVARELAAATHQVVRLPKIELTEEGGKIDEVARVSIEDKVNCPRYACRIIQNVKIGPSPDWMQKKLIASGIRPVNNIVDITNYVLLETGHPLHAFDLDQLAGHEIIVRHSEEGESFVTLDGKTRSLMSDDLMICDQEKPIAIAGVMGGSNSEVSDQTKNILLESAYFLPSSVRRTSKRLGLSTDSSKRFERGADPNQVLRSLDRAAMLMQELATGKICTGVIDVKDHEFPEKTVTCRVARTNQLLGTQLSMSEIESVFQRLGMESTWDGQDTFTVRIPTYRVDIFGEIDLIEEVARIYGFENISRAPAKYSTSTMPHAPIFLFEREVRMRMASEGLQEMLTCDLVGPKLLQVVKESVMPDEAVVTVMNPTSVEQSILRTSLLPGLLQVVKYNMDRQNDDISGYEVGRVHFKDGDQYREQSVVGIVMTGNVMQQHWDPKSREVDFFDLKGIIENFLAELGISNVTFRSDQLPQFHPGRQASVFVNEMDVGALGEVHPSIVRRLDVSQRIYFAELDLHNLVRVRKREAKMTEISQYPGSDRDWTITVEESVSVQNILDSIHEVPSRLLEKVSILDIYRSDKLGKNIKNVTFHFVYRDPRKTLAQETVDAEHARMTSEVEKRIRR